MNSDLIEQITRLQPLYNDSGVLLADDNFIVCKCMIGHIHKYNYESAIVGLCLTCVAGTTRSTLHRKTAERIFGVPFVLCQSVLDPTYMNAKLKILLKCGEQLPEAECYKSYKIVDLSNCDSKTAAKILKSINYRPRWIKTPLPDVDNLLPIEKMAR